MALHALKEGLSIYIDEYVSCMITLIQVSVWAPLLFCEATHISFLLLVYFSVKASHFTY
jgi:hypothetical protein